MGKGDHVCMRPKRLWQVNDEFYIMAWKAGMLFWDGVALWHQHERLNR